MNELKRPASVRELVDQLSRPTLIFLCELRGQPVSRANDDCRSSISRSFRGQRDEFLASLRKDDLEILLRMPIRDGDVLYELRNPHPYTKRELLELAIVAFGPTRGLGAPFTQMEEQDQEDDVDDDEDDVAESIPDATPTPADDVLMGPASVRSSSGAASAGWSHPRPIRALLSQLGMAIPNEISQDEFGALLDTLELRGFEVASANGVRLTSLHDALSIDAELRLRHDALATPTSLRNGAGSAGGGGRERPDGVELGDYERASLRLELLTAGLDSAKASQELVGKVVALATAGLAIHGAEQVLLERVATALARTQRDPLAVLTGLVRRLDAEDGEVLLREYATLHTGQDEVQLLMADHWSALCQSSAGRPVPP